MRRKAPVGVRMFYIEIILNALAVRGGVHVYQLPFAVHLLKFEVFDAGGIFVHHGLVLFAERLPCPQQAVFVDKIVVRRHIEINGEEARKFLPAHGEHGGIGKVFFYDKRKFGVAGNGLVTFLAISARELTGNVNQVEDEPEEQVIESWKDKYYKLLEEYNKALLEISRLRGQAPL